MELVESTSVVIQKHSKSKPLPRNDCGALRELKPNNEKSS